MEDKRKRTVNFTSDEKAVLPELVIKYRTVIENKKSDATTNAEKVNGWKLLSDEFNAISTYCKRAPESLKTCWENIKRQTKKESASRKREMFKTGGGRPPPPPPSTGAGCMIETILGPALEGLENPYDGDAFLDINDKENVATQSTTNECPQINSDTEENNLKWEGWTPSSLKRPVSDVLRESGNSWLKRRRPAPDQLSLSDQLIQEKINLVKTLIKNSEEDSKRRILILEEQLKQEKIKTENLMKK
ncbi:uncharacterized protein isoform X2 [Choristoneura fumiferana]|uniref:uncharacterized protein isoform X2 n=1 Tax=Choristoneura fumiferana TaxID=7141 RepID=UPI003D15A6B4